MNCLYILEINPLSVASLANIFSHSKGCLSVMFMVSFAVYQRHFCMALRNWEFSSSVVLFMLRKLQRGQEGTDKAPRMVYLATGQPGWPDSGARSSCAFPGASLIFSSAWARYTLSSVLDLPPCPAHHLAYQSWRREMNAGSSSSLWVPFCPRSLSLPVHVHPLS